MLAFLWTITRKKKKKKKKKKGKDFFPRNMSTRHLRTLNPTSTRRKKERKKNKRKIKEK